MSNDQVTNQYGVKSWHVPLLAVMIGALLFLCIHGYRILDPTFINWIKGDADAHFLGWHFFRSEPWTFPIGEIRSYYYPQGTSIVYSDSIPLVALPLKLLSPLLSTSFQYQGLWLLLCCLLQGFFAALLLRNVTANPILILLGTTFFLLNPIPLQNVAGQSALSSQWLIVASLYLYFLDDSPSTRLKWIALSMAASMIHFYLLVMVLAIFFSYLLKLMLQGRGTLFCAAKFLVFGLSAVLATMWIVGYFIIGLGDSSDIGFTYHSMNLLQPFNPAPFASMFQQPAPLATEGQGFSYLGLGLLLMIVIALLALLKQSAGANRKSLFPLALAGLCLVAFSLSTKVTLGSHVLFEMPLPFILEKAVGILRASHRMFFPVPYLLILAAFSVFAKFQKPRSALLAMLICLGVQIADLYPIYKAINLDEVTWKSPLQSNGWNILIERVKNIVVVPALEHKRMAEHEPFNGHNDYTPFVFLAAYNKKTINVGQVARFGYEARRNYREKLFQDFEKGIFDPDSLYVIGEKSYLTQTNLVMEDPANSNFMWGVLDGYAIIAPKVKSVELQPWPDPVSR